jgi:glycosyltransferase involved in cell wall biosynthesis
VRVPVTLATLIKKISVIIPTRNREQSLATLLDSLALAQSPEGAAVEIVVVDNGSTDGTAVMLQERIMHQSRYPLRVFNQPTPGKSNALNLALANCEGDLLVVFDDDVTVERRCLVELAAAYQNGQFGAMQGRILPGKDSDGRSADLSRLREYNIPLIDYGGEIREIRGLTGTNMSFNREVLDAIGCFDARLGPGAAGFSEDTEFSMRIRKAGFKIGYTPHAVVYHELNPDRYGRAYNRDVEYRKGISRSLYRRDSMAFNVMPNLFANCLRLVLYRSLGKREKAYKTEGRLFKCLGYVAGKLRRVPSTK